MPGLNICEDCGKVYQGGPHSFFCPKCRKARISRAAKRWNLNKIGNDAYSQQRADIRKESDPDEH